jgi:hypothetical protein
MDTEENPKDTNNRSSKRLAIRSPYLIHAVIFFVFLEYQAPSLPNSAVHSSFRERSSWLTVGRAALTALMKSLITSGGSRSLSESTSTQDISMAPLSPGEHGVSFSTSPSRTWCKILVFENEKKVDYWGSSVPFCSESQFESCE